MSEAVAERAPLPTGTVTFLFSDIEGSTQRWEQHRDEMKTAVAWHDTIVRKAVEANGGLVFKTIGDAFCVVFKTVPQAIQAALDAQRAIEHEDWSKVGGLKVRMAIHTGFADERDADYFGPTVNRVARLLSIGHGGQVLVSGVSTELSQGMMPTSSDAARSWRAPPTRPHASRAGLSTQCARSTRGISCAAIARRAARTTFRCSSPSSSAAKPTLPRSKRCSPSIASSRW